MTDVKMEEKATAVPEKAVRHLSMQAAVFAGPEQLELRDIPRPKPASGEVRVQLEGCGICASDLPLWEGREWFEYPQAPGASGHEGWGRVEAVGPDVSRLSEGDRVAVLSHHAYAEFDTVPASQVVQLPAELDGKPFPGEPLGCAMNVFRRSAIQPGQTVAIVGVGFLGALLVQMAVDAGARVLAVSRRPIALQMAEQFGADTTFRMEQGDDVAGQMMEATGGVGCDCVIEATGKQAPLDLASDLVRVRGRLVIAGYHQDGPRTVNMQSWNWRGIDVINAHERDPERYIQGMGEAVDAVSSGQLNPSPLYTHTFPLEKIADAFRLVEQRPEGFMKALITA